ncbi:hypothetical protein DFR70_13331 [Nocardia tenerifensis]|uniref:Protein involved in plasmid replication-relaxation n=1 Tax=Nocardia tenerifensis TaxID=228006 RepID=A0A318JRG1_9NOCA|nr:hypothetical protein [Nocardia tenerifensis]PXX52299.1 hypothetical protein DFR70_13331 [Nocardia tenerifensis]
MSNRLMGPRDLTALTITAEMYAAPADRVARMLGLTSTNDVYRYLRKWRRAHLIVDERYRPVPGPTWAVPTRTAVEAFLPFYARFWSPTPKMAAHVTTVLDVRLALVGLDLERWISERQLRSEQGRPVPGRPRGHVHDGRFYRGDGSLWAVEVELTAKNATAARSAVVAAKQAAAAGGCDGLIYYCKTEWLDAGGEVIRHSDHIKTVITEAARYAASAVEGPPIRVADLGAVLPKASAATSTTRPGLMVIEGGASDHGDPDAAAGEAVLS